MGALPSPMADGIVTVDARGPLETPAGRVAKAVRQPLVGQSSFGPRRRSSHSRNQLALHSVVSS